MAVSEVTFEQVLKLARRLTPAEQARLVARLAKIMEEALAEGSSLTSTGAHIRLRGLLADLGPAPSAEEIDAARREMWAGFPRDET